MPGFTITGELSSSATGSTWAAVRDHDDRALVVRIVKVSDVTEAQAQTTQLMAVLHRIENEHLVVQHDAIALADGTLALILDEVTGGTLAHVLDTRGPLTPGETVTTVAPLFGALADLHAAGVVHGDLAPGIILFSSDGRPLVSELGVARLLALDAGPVERASGFVAPEVVGGAAPSPASDVYAMAAIGWFCLTGAPPAPAATRQSQASQSLASPSLTTVRAETPPRLVEVLTWCLSRDPAARPLAGAAGVEVFEAAPAEPVAMAAVPDPATEITRRIRAAAVSAPTVAPPSPAKRHLRALVIGVISVLVAAVLGGGATWFLGRPPDAVRPIAVQPATIRSVARPSATPSTTTASSATTPPVARATPPSRITDVVTAPDSPQTATTKLLQALVDARALAYVARDPVLLDLVYAPGATMAGVDRGNIVTALKNGATYLGLGFVVRDVAFLDGTSTTARIRATIVTPAYQTGQPDGRKVPHAQEIVGPSVFSLRLSPDGWRVLSLSAP